MDSWRDVSVPELPGRGPEVKVADAGGEPVVAASGPVATLYACGITPYDATHIGHAATFIAWDLLIRAWRDAGHQVRYVQNVTDVDDPLLERADRDHEDWRELADREIALFRDDMEALRVLPPADYIGAVEALPVIERLTRLLADHGSLYDLDGDVYFARSADPSFGAVSGLDAATMTELFAERGGDPGRPGKKDPLDALVWLAARPGEPSWPSGFGSGRPGWHVECAAIATEYLGVTFDVQAGGTDLIFPHHEMSASHARVALAGRARAGGTGLRPALRARGHGAAGRGEDVQVAGQPRVRVPAARGRCRPDGHPAGDPRPPLPAGLGLDRCRAGGGAGAARPLARRGRGGRGARRAGLPGHARYVRARACSPRSASGWPTTSTRPARWPRSTPGPTPSCPRRAARTVPSSATPSTPFSASLCRPGGSHPFGRLERAGTG